MFDLICSYGGGKRISSGRPDDGDRVLPKSGIRPTSPVLKNNQGPLLCVERENALFLRPFRQKFDKVPVGVGN